MWLQSATAAIVREGGLVPSRVVIKLWKAFSPHIVVQSPDRKAFT